VGQGDVRFEIRGAAAWLTIDRPDRRNALNDEVIDGLLEGLARAGRGDGVRCVVLTGAGDRAFCAGADLKDTMAPGEGGADRHDLRGKIARLYLALVRHPLPVIARVNGVTLAGGLGLVAASDLAIAADDASFGTPEADLGLWPFMASAVIRRDVSRKAVMELLLTGRRCSATEAERIGLINRAVPRPELDAAIDELVGVVAAKGPLAVRLGKQSFWRSEDMGLDAAMGYLNAMLTVCLQSEDVAEGVSAFLEKRPPSWTGR